MFTQNQVYETYHNRRIAHWNNVALQTIHWKGCGGYYHQRLQQIYRFWIKREAKILEIGCGEGDLLASLSPSIGVGIDFSTGMLQKAQAKYTNLRFYEKDAHDFQIEERDFDYIILSDILNDVWDVQTVFENLGDYCNNHTRILLNSYSRLWETPLSITGKLGLAKPVLDQNWLTVEDVKNLLDLSGFEMIRSWQEIILPLKIPYVSSLLNHFLVRIWPLSEFALTNFMLARKIPTPVSPSQLPSISIVIPARNEAGNIKNIF